MQKISSDVFRRQLTLNMYIKAARLSLQVPTIRYKRLASNYEREHTSVQW